MGAGKGSMCPCRGLDRWLGGILTPVVAPLLETPVGVPARALVGPRGGTQAEALVRPKPAESVRTVGEVRIVLLGYTAGAEASSDASVAAAAYVE